MFVDILLPLPLKTTFTYGVPLELQDGMKVGVRVEVSFGRNKIYSGIVKNVHQEKPEGYQVKPIRSIIDKEAIVTNEQLKFWEWMASYYMCSEGDVMNAALPSYLKLSSESIVSLNSEMDIDESQLNDDEFILIEALKAKNEKRKK